MFGSETICGACITTLERSGELNQQFKFVITKKTLPPLPPEPQPPQVQQQIPPPPPSIYFPIPSFQYPYSDRNSIVDALKSIGVDSSLKYRALIGQTNGIPGRVGNADFNVKMLNLLKSGKLKKP